MPEDAEGCKFLVQAIGDQLLSEIIGHIEKCRACSSALDHFFEAYTEFGWDHDGYELPSGILTKADFLKAWHFTECSRSERDEHVMISLARKLRSPKVQNAIRALNRTQLLLTFPPAIAQDANFSGRLERNLRKVHELLGNAEFVYFMTDDLDPDRQVLEILIDWWKDKCPKV